MRSASAVTHASIALGLACAVGAQVDDHEQLVKLLLPAVLASERPLADANAVARDLPAFANVLDELVVLFPVRLHSRVLTSTH